MAPLLTTLSHRPYVFCFLAAFLILAWRRWGWQRTLLWLVSGYTIAWISEVASINTGVPYGWYFYIPDNLRGELLVAGVPFFDSLSYAFLTFAGYTTGEFILSRRTTPPSLQGGSRGEGIALVLLGALLTTLLDVIIDPIATMGDKWFLGQIHWYASPGWYFGVPMTNFGGWFLVAFAVIGFNVLGWKAFPHAFGERTNGRAGERAIWLFPAFYAGIALFSIAISFWVGAWKLGLASSGILAAIALFAIISRRKGNLT